MAKYKVYENIHEIQVDEKGNFLKAYEENLPHHEAMTSELSKSWNDLHKTLVSVANEDCDNRIKSCKMRGAKVNNKTYLCIEFVAKEGKRLTQNIKDAINDFVSAQMTDGWGEGDLGPINIMTGSDGTRFYAD